MGNRNVVRATVRNQRGIILPLILVFLALGLLLLTPMLGLASTSLTTGGVYQNKAVEQHAADGGLERGIHFLKYNFGAWDPDETPIFTLGRFYLNECSVDVSISAETDEEGNQVETNEGVPIWLIQSIASVQEGSVTVIEARVAGIAGAAFDVVSDIPGGSTNLGKKYEIDGDTYIVFDVQNISADFTFPANTIVVIDGPDDAVVDNVNGGVMEPGSVVVFKDYVEKFNGNTESEGTVIFCNGLGEFLGNASSSMLLVVYGLDHDEALRIGVDPWLTIGANASIAGTTVVYWDLVMSANASVSGTTVVYGNISGTTQNISGTLCTSMQPPPPVAIGTTIESDCGTIVSALDLPNYCALQFSDWEIKSYVVA